MQVCSVWTSNQDNPLTTESDAADGFATVRLDGKRSREGVATVTVTVGGLTKQLDVTMYGHGQEPDGRAGAGLRRDRWIEVFVVLTVTDDAGNPVVGSDGHPYHHWDRTKEVVGP